MRSDFKKVLRKNYKTIQSNLLPDVQKATLEENAKKTIENQVILLCR